MQLIEIHPFGSTPTVARLTILKFIFPVDVLLYNLIVGMLGAKKTSQKRYDGITK